MVPTLYNTGLLAIAALIGSSSAHIKLAMPVPFGKASLSTSPLKNVAIDGAGSDFPCQQRADVYNITSMNNMNVGDTQTLSFEGSASHGGGTCQLAVSLDLEPTATSIWKLIQVYEGGCPITVGSGAADGAGTQKFSYKIPENFPNGRATLAWTWYNRIGNREIYMNCAPIDVTGGSDNKDYYNTLPNMYVINLPTSTCSSVEMSSQEIPVPGQFVLKGDPADKVAPANGAGCAAAAAAQTSGVSNLATGSADNGTAVTSGSSSGAATTAAANNNPGAGAGAGTAQPSGMTTLASSAPVSLAISAPASSATVAPIATTQAADGQASATATPPASSPTDGSSTGTAYAGGSTNGTASNGGSSCPTDGAIVCNGPSQFGLCDHGQVVWQAVAAGTTCQNGQISKRSDDDSLVHKMKAHLRRHQRDYSS